MLLKIRKTVFEQSVSSFSGMKQKKESEPRMPQKESEKTSYRHAKDASSIPIYPHARQYSLKSINKIITASHTFMRTHTQLHVEELEKSKSHQESTIFFCPLIKRF
ncbi:hypothetical protein Droror1_Dr00024021 [Drosera rotundifolia]